MPNLYQFAAICILSWSCQIRAINSIDLGIMSGMQTLYKSVKSIVTETCDVNANNITGLDMALRTRLHGQPFVRDIVVGEISDHLKNTNPQKALVLSFHGWVGVGKNFVSHMIAESIFQQGYSSKFVKLFVATDRFPHERYPELYQQQLKEEIVATVCQCDRSLFIFDEFDKTPIGLLDVLKPYMDYHPHVNGVDFRKAIFIFLSYLGAEAINKYTLAQWHQGIPRDEIEFKALENISMTKAYNVKGGLQRSYLTSSPLISAFVPFLPLERKHVKLCIRDILNSSHKHLKVNASFADIVADELLYDPEKLELFSHKGCKGLINIINRCIFMENSGKQKSEL